MFKVLRLLFGLFIGSLAFSAYATDPVGTVKVINRCPDYQIYIRKQGSPGCTVLGENRSEKGKNFEPKVIAKKGCSYTVESWYNWVYKSVSVNVIFEVEGGSEKVACYMHGSRDCNCLWQRRI